MTGRRVVTLGFMVIIVLWLYVVSFPLNWDSLWLMTTDGCGQVMQPEKLPPLRLLMTSLIWLLIFAIAYDCLFPKSSWSAWVVSLSVISFLASSVALILLHADFLTRCDVFIVNPRSLASSNIMTIAAVIAAGFRTMRKA